MIGAAALVVRRVLSSPIWICGLLVLSPPVVAASLDRVEAPGWVLAIQPGTWAPVSDNTIKAVDPQNDPTVNPNYPNAAPWKGTVGIAGLIQNWSGGTFASKYGAKGSLLLFGGGHSGYLGNGVFAFDMESRRWHRATDPWPGELGSMSDPVLFPTGLYPEARWPSGATAVAGSPTVQHTYDQLEYDPRTNSLVVAGTATDSWAAGVNSDERYRIHRVLMLSLDTKTWRTAPVNEKKHFLSGGSSAYDRNRGTIWFEAGNVGGTLVRFDPSVVNNDGTFGTYENFDQITTQIDKVMAVDPLRDLIVEADFRNPNSPNGQVVWAAELSNPDPSATKAVLKTGGQSPPMDVKPFGAGWEWSDARGAFVYWRRGAEVYELRLAGPDWRQGPWMWSMITDKANGVIPEDMAVDNGVYGRFRIASYKNAEVAIVVNRVDGAVFAFRLPTVARPKSPEALSVK